MKKFFTLLVMAITSLAMMAKDYTCPLVVSLSGMDFPPIEGVTVSVDKQSNGKYTLKLLNFDMGGAMPVGNIVVEDVDAVTCGTTIVLSAQKNITITEGDKELDEDQSWLGPKLGIVPINMQGELKGDKFNAILNIDMSKMAMNIGVKLGDDWSLMGQIPNSGFETYHKATVGDVSSDEPNAWHSFMSSTGGLSNMVNKTAHTFISDEVRPGSTGSHSVKVTSGIVVTDLGPMKINTPANGTITTGRLNAGSITAEDEANNSFLDMSTTDVDGNGDPFYAVLTNRPDSIVAWVKFKQGTLANKYKDSKYATISAIITDGTKYQDPEDPKTTYANVVAKAKNATIESKDFAWQRIVVPFDYETYKANNANPKAILVTMSTNATPGAASKDEANPDVLYVDDVELIYNCDIKSLKFKGTEMLMEDGGYETEYNGDVNLDDIEVEATSPNAFINKSLLDQSDDEEKLTMATITVVSNDLKNANVYYFSIKGASITGIKKTETVKNNTVSAIYNANGQRVSNMNQPGLYIIKNTDGKTVKFLKK